LWVFVFNKLGVEVRYIIYTDIHCGSPIELMNVDELVSGIVQDVAAGHQVIDIGDNIDLANCHKRDLSKHNAAYASLFGYDKRSDKYFKIDGNHERMKTGFQYTTSNDVCFTHGDFEKWGKKKAIKYRSKKRGASAFKRKFIVPLIEWAEKFGVNRATKKFKRRAVKVAKSLGCHTYVCGHIHPKEKLDFNYDGVRIIVMPRGRSELELHGEE
jgi:hypothetical protein